MLAKSVKRPKIKQNPENRKKNPFLSSHAEAPAVSLRKRAVVPGALDHV
jgi:hypothetical protein